MRLEKEKYFEGLSLRCFSVALILTLTTWIVGYTTYGFNGRWHEEMTTVAMWDFGFHEMSIRAVVVANLLTDVYAATYEILRDWTVYGDQEAARWFHFDNLFDPWDVDIYWYILKENAKDALTKLGDPIDRLFLIGIVLHAVQDFYSHSNWVELWDQYFDEKAFCPLCFPTWDEAATSHDSDVQNWFNMILDMILDEFLHTGAYKAKEVPPWAEETHDDLNKDAPNSARGQIVSRSYPGCGTTYFEVALAVATKATREWLERFKSWLSPDDWDTLLSAGKGQDPLRYEYVEIRSLIRSTGKWDKNESCNKLSVVDNFLSWNNRFYKRWDKVVEIIRNLWPSLINDNPARVYVEEVY